MSFEGVDEGLPCPAQAKAILPVHVVRVQLGLSDHSVHVSGLDRQDGGVLEWNTMAQVDAVFSHG
jgi:hypothetical protein